MITLLVWQAKCIRFLSRVLRKGSGTAASGWLVEKYCPNILSFYASKFKKIILVSGTNGKTTTRTMIVHILKKNYNSVVTNSGGANILRGIAACLLMNTSKTKDMSQKYLVLEVEEATLPKVSRLLQPDILVLTNLFRDQLDMYGELETTLSFFHESAQYASAVVVNTSDTRLATITGKRVIHVHVQNVAIEYELFQNKEQHIAHYRFTRKENILKLRDLTFSIHTFGDYNIVNMAIAIATTDVLGVSIDGDVFRDYKEPFGRHERLIIGNNECYLVLVKNPSGVNNVMQSILSKEYTLFFGLQDNVADGKDVSWIYDFFAEKWLDTRCKEIICFGSRGLDMQVRLTAALRNNLLATTIKTVAVNDVPMLIKHSQTQICYVLVTYTALLELRKMLQKLEQLQPIDSVEY